MAPSVPLSARESEREREKKREKKIWKSMNFSGQRHWHISKEEENFYQVGELFYI